MSRRKYEDEDELTDEEILELEALISEEENEDLRDKLKTLSPDMNPNYKFLFEALRDQWYEERIEIPKHLEGQELTDAILRQFKKQELVRGYRGCILEGSSRSGKTWAGIDFIIYICLHLETNCIINIVRETFAEFADTLYDDFRRRLDDFYLPNPFHKAKIVKSFKINGNTIKFLGSDKIGKKHGAGCDYLFFNEMISVPEGVFDQLEMRCRKFWWADYNPSVTDHYIFNKIIPRKEIGFLRTTFRDNPHISYGEISKILSYEPWQPGSYEVRDSQILTMNHETGELEPISETLKPPPHPINIDQGTANEFDWKVYGLGLRGAMKGVIYTNVRYINEWPDMDFIYANDFGFTTDPNATGKYAETETEIYVELLLYSPVDTPEALDNYFDKIGMERGKPLICDSSDKYTAENKGTVEMVSGLRNLGWEAKKISKTKSVMYWIGTSKKKRINIVKNSLYHLAKKEIENYRMKEIQGILINQPIDKNDHFCNMFRYGHMAWNAPDSQIVW